MKGKREKKEERKDERKKTKEGRKEGWKGGRKRGKEEGKGREDGKGRRKRGKGEGRKGTQFPGEADAPQDPQLHSPGRPGAGGPRRAPRGPRCLAGQMVSFPPVRARFQPHAVILFFWNETGVASQRGPIRTKRKSCE